MQRKFESIHEVGKEIITNTVRLEGGFVDHPDDPGGATHWGITESRARGAGYMGDMADMPESWALDFYAEHEWFANNYHHIEHIESLVKDVYDFGVNAGQRYSVKILQRALNLCNRNGQDWEDLVVDGFLGLKTSRAANSCICLRGEAHLLKVLNVGQGRHYWDLAEKKPHLQAFFNGWLSHRVEL